MIAELFEGLFFRASFKLIVTCAAFHFLQHFAFFARESHCCCQFFHIDFSYLSEV